MKVEDSGTLELSAGPYFFDKLDVKKKATVAVDASGGKVEVNVDEKVKFDKDSKLAITPVILTGSRSKIPVVPDDFIGKEHILQFGPCPNVVNEQVAPSVRCANGRDDAHVQPSTG